MIRRPIHMGRAAAGIAAKVMLVQIADKVRLTSNGTTTWIFLDLELEELLSLGPWFESIIVVTGTHGSTANHAWKVVSYWSIDGRNWNGPTDLFLSPNGIVAGSGSTIQAPYTTTSTFGPQMKYALGVRNNTGAAIETAVVDAWLQLTFKS